MQRRGSVGGRSLDARAAVDQQPDRGLVPVRGGPEQRRPPVAIFCIDFGPAVEKQLCRGLVPVLGRPVQWSSPVPVLGFEIGTIKDEKCYRNSFVFFTRQAQSRSTFAIYSIYAIA